MSTAESAKQLYESELKDRLEADHHDSFISAAMSAKSAYPDRKSFVLRIGHAAAFHLGASST